MDPEGEAFDAFRKNISKRQPQPERGKVTTIPTPQDVQQQLHAQNRIPATELNAKERRRLMREATARLESDKRASHVELAGYDKPETEIAADEDDSAVQSLEDPEERGDEELPAPRQQRAKTVKRHILDDE